MKIAVLGHSASGKSTLAERLGERYGIPVLHLDRVAFCPGWKERYLQEARGLVEVFMKQESWVIDGNYKKYGQRERLDQADEIVILDFPRLSCLIRACKRYVRYRGRTRDDMAEGCREKIDPAFVWWILYEGRTAERHRHLREIRERYPGKTVVLKNQRQLDRFSRDPLAFRRADPRL